MSEVYKSVVQSLPIGVVVFDTDLKIIETNPQAAQLIKLMDSIDASLTSGTDEQIWGNWSEQLKSAISNSRPCSFDNIVYTSGAKTKFLHIICTALKDTATRQTTGGALMITDITEKVNIQRQLASFERLAAVGRVASKVAHELNNPMDGILRYINLTIRILERENLDKPNSYLQQCRKALMRMVQIVSELLEFSRSTYSASEYARIDTIIEDAVKMMGPKAAASNVRVSRKYDPAIPSIRSGNLFQVFCNLIKNALDVMPEGGKLTISAGFGAEHTVIIQFRDTGPGVPAESAEAIFEPFFTTKEKTKGTGLGLAICKDIIERYNGRITAENAPDGGSIFTVYLPLMAENLIHS